MSHTTTFTGLVINNLKALNAGLDLLNQEFLKAGREQLTVVEDSHPVLYYPDQYVKQFGKGSTCDFVIKHKESLYDLGLHWSDKDNQYLMVYDNFGGHIRKVFGYTSKELETIKSLYNTPITEPTEQLGRFIQAYNTGLALEMIKDQGYQVEEIKYNNYQYELELANSI